MLKHLHRASVLRFPRRRTLNPKTYRLSKLWILNWKTLRIRSIFCHLSYRIFDSTTFSMLMSGQHTASVGIYIYIIIYYIYSTYIYIYTPLNSVTKDRRFSTFRVCSRRPLIPGFPLWRFRRFLSGKPSHGTFGDFAELVQLSESVWITQIPGF